MKSLEGRTIHFEKGWSWVFFFPMIILAFACSEDTGSPDGVKDTAIITVVNEKEVSVKRFRQEFKSLKKKFRVENQDYIKPDQLLWLKNNALSQVIHDELLKQEAKKNHLSVTQDEFRQALSQAKIGYPEDSFNRFLEIEGISLPEWENKLKINVLIKKLINKMVNSKVLVNEKELVDYYNTHEQEFQKGEQIHALHIMVETEDEAGLILKKLESGKEDFSELAKLHSLSPEGPEGGNLGFVEAGQMPAELDDIFKLKVGALSNIISTPYGFHIFKVVEKKTDQKMNFEESRNIIHDNLLRKRQEKAFEKWLMELKGKAKIEINHDILAQIA